MSKITHLECHKALKAALTRNFKFRWLDVEFSKDYIAWYLAVQNKGDAARQWYPKIAVFYPKDQKVCVLERLGAKPKWMDVDVLIAMSKPASPPPSSAG